MTIQRIIIIFGAAGLYQAFVILLGALDFPRTQINDLRSLSITWPTHPLPMWEYFKQKVGTTNISVAKLTLAGFATIPLRILSCIPLPMLLIGMLSIIADYTWPERWTVDLTYIGTWVVIAGLVVEVLCIAFKIVFSIPQILIQLHPLYRNKTALTVVLDIYPVVKK